MKSKIRMDEHGLADGADVFRFYDTHGVPLELLIQKVASAGLIINCRSFAHAAKKAGWKLRKILAIWREAWSMMGVRDVATFDEKIELAWNETAVAP